MTGLILIFTPKYGTRAYFRGMYYFIYQKMKLQSKNYEILNKQKLRKKDLHLLAINMFFIQKLINNNLFKIQEFIQKDFLKKMAYTALKQFE